MSTFTYLERRGELEVYFDRTAADAWARLTSTAPVGRIRATVRAGRNDMRRTLTGYLPQDLSGARLLDAGCGTGALSLEAAERGATVLAIDLSPTMIGLAHDRTHARIGTGCVEFRVGDMQDPALGEFDHIVAMDSLIHYGARDVMEVLAGLASRTRRSLVFTFAPRTFLLMTMWTAGRLFPRKNRAPALEPIAESVLRRCVARDPRLKDFRVGRTRLIDRGFYKSQAMEAHTTMSRLAEKLAQRWMKVGVEFLPFADAASPQLPLARLLRLSLFQVSVGIAMVLLIGTLNRVLIVELGVPAWSVSLMVGLPLVFAPFRAFIGFRSDNHRSALGWRRVPYIWMGTLLQFGGLAIMPFALLILSGDTHGPLWIGQVASALAFLLTGAGLQVTQTAGLALATDLAPEDVRPRVIALMYVMLLVGMVGAGVVCGRLLANFSELRLIQVVQGAAMATMALNLAALWKQEPRDAKRTARDQPAARFRDSWQEFMRHRRALRFLVTVGLGTAAFNMQDIVLEPYGGEILHLPVGATTALTAMLAGGMLAAFCVAARFLVHGADPYRIAAYGAVVGLFAFAGVIFAAPMGSPQLFRLSVLLIGLGGGFFLVGTLAAAMARERNGESGLALGAWGAVQAMSAGIAIAAGGAMRDAITGLAVRGALGPTLNSASTGYGAVYQLEILLLFATLVAIGPLVRSGTTTKLESGSYGWAEFPN